MNEILEQKKTIILDLGFNSERFEFLKKYVNLLWAANSELNLFSRQTSELDLINNHIIDCLLPLKHWPLKAKNVADFGSGGGLPGLIYGLNFPEIHFHLFEKSPLKQNFLNECTKKLNLQNIQVQSNIPNKLPDYDLITARGFKPIDVILEISSNYYLKNGKYFLLKGRIEKINEEISASLKRNKNLKWTSVPLQSPVLEVERHLVLINN